jgi:hypothetical protein
VQTTTLPTPARWRRRPSIRRIRTPAQRGTLLTCLITTAAFRPMRANGAVGLPMRGRDYIGFGIRVGISFIATLIMVLKLSRHAMRLSEGNSKHPACVLDLSSELGLWLGADAFPNAQRPRKTIIESSKSRLNATLPSAPPNTTDPDLACTTTKAYTHTKGFCATIRQEVVVSLASSISTKALPSRHSLSISVLKCTGKICTPTNPRVTLLRTRKYRSTF